jgi:malonate-semialdehyde dehydrogenase (acetylating)/methylmalonate-semialdehyde dehydrogenase
MSDALMNYVENEWRAPQRFEYADVQNPATGETLARVPMSSKADTTAVIEAAAKAAASWASVPAIERIQYLFKLKTLIEENLDDLCRICTSECGKTYGESKGEFQRAIENIETACGIPILMQGHTSEDIARGIDEYMFRQPMGVVAAITPFNFPGMIPFWFLPYALATGNCMILKPSEKTPMTATRIFELVVTLGLPPGVLQMVHGGRDAVETLLDHPVVRAISFVGSSSTARIVYQRAAANGKRAQCQGGAKNPVVILPDADMDMTVKIVADAAFGCAGQRCLALSQVITVGAAHEAFMQRIVEVAQSRKVGHGLGAGVEMGPVISAESKARIESLITRAEEDGARVRVDGRGRQVDGYEKGNFVFPTILEDLPAVSTVSCTEIFGPVLTCKNVNTLDEAIVEVNSRVYGNMACIFTSSGAAARRFRQEVSAGNVGINIGVAAPLAFFPFSGWNESFFGDLHAQGRHGVEFYTQTKVVVERWPKEWNRQF